MRLKLCIIALIMLHCKSSELVVRSIPKKDRKVILFQDFVNNSGENGSNFLESMTKGIPDLVIGDFASFGAFRTVSSKDRVRALNELGFQQMGITDEGSMVAAGKLLNAEYLLTGSFTEIQENISISARLVNVETGEVYVAASAIGPTKFLIYPPDQALVKKLSIKLLANFDFEITENETKLIRNNIQTTSLQAAVENYKGEQVVDKVEFMKNQNQSQSEIKKLEDQAKEDFKKALSYDSNYEKAKKNLASLTQGIPMTL